MNYYERRQWVERFGGLPSRHPGSKPGYHHKPAGKGNVWRAVSCALRSYPGWKKRVVRLAQENGWQQ